MKISALTSCCVDFFPEEEKVYVGGNSLNFATQCKLSGIDNVSVLGAVGNDSFGKKIINHLDKVQIDQSHLHTMDAPTASNKIYLDEKGDRYFKADSWNGGAFDLFRLSEDDWDYLHDSNIIAMPAGDPNLSELLRRIRNEQLVAVDFLDYFGIDDIARHIANIDIVFLSGKEGMLDGLQQISEQSGKLIVATLGARGSIAFYKNSVTHQSAIEADEIIDTTGCGDAFQAAFCINWYTNRNIKQALKVGALAASRVLGFMGGVE
ncbi:hypothetical protein KEM09_19395 [Carboxylicivirga mesophila]|uniref:Carbohydrate kinase PfkB domain-containing protein n=1 Tax=Carboxylicivirga mesophila TaxID=1166478 RepID=A0ABS5KFB0_9BACT|nr:PfkB family carbohydrate kinase [Carboxylicivirga mesophila]MBS2213582.1 hypothetical protein [Carboxylicivirga mesophila]